MNTKKIFKFLKYCFVTSFIFIISTLLGQKNSPDYSIISIAHADIPSGSGGGNGNGAGIDGYGGDTVDGNAADGAGTTDGSSSDGTSHA